MQLTLLLSLLLVLISHPKGITAPNSEAKDSDEILKQFDYTNQVIASIGDDKSVEYAAEYLSKKHASVVADYDLKCKWDPETESFTFQGEKSPDSIKEFKWDSTKIQLVAHGEIKETGDIGDKLLKIGGFTPEQLADHIGKLTGSAGAKKITLVSCSREPDSRDPQKKNKGPPDYMKKLMEALLNKNIPVEEVTMRNSLVSVDSNGRKLTGEAVFEGGHKRSAYGFKWTSRNRDLKWVATVAEGNDGKKTYNIKNSQAVEGAESIETRYLGVLGKDEIMYLRDKQDPKNAYKVTDEEAFQMLDKTAKDYYGKTLANEQASAIKQKVSMYDSKKKEFTPSEEIELKEFNSVTDLIKEIKYKATEFETTGGKPKEELYRFGNLVIHMDATFYARVVGIAESGISEEDLNAMKSQFKEIPVKKVDYPTIKSKTSHTEEFFGSVKKWFTGKNNEMGTTPKNFEEHFYNAQSGTAMFLSESIRCFQNHFTNMMAMDMVEAGVLNKDLFFGTNINPMARGGSWPDQAGVGTQLIDILKNPDKGKKAAEKKKWTDEAAAIKERLARITKSWLSHLESDTLSGLRDKPPQATVKKLAIDLGDTIKKIGTNPPATKEESSLRIYEQKLSDRLLSTDISEPETSSMETQSNGLSTIEDSSAPLRTSLALASDQTHTTKAISDAIETREKAVNKKFEMVSDSVKVIEGKYIAFKVYDKENPSHTEDVMATVDDSKLLSKAMVEDLQKQAEDFEKQPPPDGEQESTTSRINKGLAIFGVVQGLGGAFSNFEDGDYAEGTISLAQSLHGLGDLAGVNQKIWQASKSFLQESLQGPINELSETTLATDAEKMAGTEISSVVGEVDSGLSLLDDVPIIGTAFAIYNIVEDFERHSTIGYIDAGLDITIAGLAFLGPEAEPFVIALTVIRMGIDTFYNDISKELNALPDNATLSQRVTAVFKGIGDAVVDLCEQFTLVGQIYGAIDKSSKLDEEYEKQQEFLKSLTDFQNYYNISKSGSSKQINFGEGSLSLFGGGIKLVLGESGTSELTIEVFDSTHQDRSITKTIETPRVEDITMGIGESYSFTFTQEKVKLFWCIPVDTKWMISGNTTDIKSLHGEYIGNSKDNGFYAIQELPSKLHLSYELDEYFYQLRGGDGNDFFYLGPQITYVTGNEGSDTYYITSHITSTVIFNYAEDLKPDYLLLYLNFKDIKTSRQGDDAVFTSSSKSDGHLVKVKYWFTGDQYQHMILKTQDGLVCTLSATETDTELEITPYAFDGKSYKSGVTFDAKETIMLHVKILTGSPYDDNLYGNGLDNQINGNGGSDTVIGHNGRDLYILRDNINTHCVINNYADDEKTDILEICARNKEDVELAVSGDNLLIRSHSCSSEVKIENWFTNTSYQHLMLASADGEVLNISTSRDNLKLQLVMIDLTLQSEHDFELDLFMFTKDLSSPDTGRYTYKTSNGIDLSADPHFTKVVTVIGSNNPDWIVGNQQNNYMSAGKGRDFLYGKEGYDVYVIRQGDGLNTIFQKFRGDQNMDTILFDAPYDDIELVNEDLYFGLQAYKSDEDRYMAVALSCLLDEERESENRYHLSASLQTCFTLNSLYYVKSNDGVVFTLPTSEEDSLVKTALLVDYSKSDKPLTIDFTSQLPQVKRFVGSHLKDNILANSLNNYIDPGVGGCYMQGGNGSDTYVIRANYGTDNGIYNLAKDYRLDTLLFLVPFFSIAVKVNGDDVLLTSNGPKGQVSVSLYNYAKADDSRHLIVVTDDGITFALPPKEKYIPMPLIINRAQKQAGQYINLTANSNFTEVKTVYGADGFQNHLVGNEKSNTIVGGSKDDLIEGLLGDDVLKGGAGKDTLNGGLGRDNLVGGPGDDTLYGGDDDDVLAPGLGNNLVYGGDGVDTVIYGGESGGIEALLPENMIYHPHDTVVDRVYDVENVFGTVHDDILQGDDEDNVLLGYDGDDQLFTGKDGYDILNGGNGSDTYSWIRAVKAFTSAIHSTMIVNNYATDGKTDTILHDINVQTRSQLGFEKSGNDLVIRKISEKYPVFYDNGPIVILKSWFHAENANLYRHVELKLAEETLSCKQLVTIGEEAAEREQQNNNVMSST